jgi:nitroreductase
MIRYLKRIRRKLIIYIKVFFVYSSDYKNHLKFSADYKLEKKYKKDSLRCSIMLLNHQLEKAQTYSDTKLNYGKDKVTKLLGQVEQYISEYGFDDVVSTSNGVLESHFQNEKGWRNEIIIEKYRELLIKYDLDTKKKNVLGGIELYDPSTIKTLDGLKDFLRSRRSCRLFSDEAISIEIIQDAIRDAMTAPSACNRQTTRVHIYEDKTIIEKLVRAQKADIDWCLKADKLLIITSNKFYYRNYLERNQGMFDSGLFSMILNLSLHNMNIGCCFKMAQKSPEIDQATKSIGNIPDNEDINVLFLIGRYPKQPFIVAKSARIHLENVFTLH